MKRALSRVLTLCKKDSLRRSDSLPSDDSNAVCTRRFVFYFDHKSHWQIHNISWDEAYHYPSSKTGFRNQFKKLYRATGIKPDVIDDGSTIDPRRKSNPNDNTLDPVLLFKIPTTAIMIMIIIMIMMMMPGTRWSWTTCERATSAPRVRGSSLRVLRHTGESSSPSSSSWPVSRHLDDSGGDDSDASECLQTHRYDHHHHEHDDNLDGDIFHDYFHHNPPQYPKPTWREELVRQEVAISEGLKRDAEQVLVLVH